MYVSNITLANGGGISGLSVESFGTSGAPIDTAFISNVASGTFHLTSAGLYGNIVNSGGSTVLNPADGVVAQETTAQTLTNKTLGTTLAANNTQTIGNATTGFATVYASTFDGVKAELTGTSNIAVINGTSATFSGNVGGTYFNGIATQAHYADMAEIYSSDVEYEAGTVIKIGGDKEITQTTEEADSNVFGIISTSPGFEMNAGAGTDETHPFVALAGRVPCKVIGKVVKGDRLISSNTPGTAIANTGDSPDYRPIIGRALESKDTEDAGTIEVVVGAK